MQGRTVQVGTLAAIVTAQALLIGSDARRMVSAFGQAAECFSLAAQGLEGWSGLVLLGLFAWAGGLLPLAVALAVGGAAAWTLRAFSAAPQRVEGLGLPLLVLCLLQFLLLAFWFWLLPAEPSGDSWINDGLAYTVLLVCTTLAWLFCNTLLLWRAASGAATRADPQDLRRVYALARAHSRRQARHAPQPPVQDTAPHPDD